MRTRPDVVAEGFRHETRDRAMLSRDGLHHEAEEGETVRRGQYIRITEIDFELAVPAFLVEGIEPPAKFLDIAREFLEEGTGERNLVEVVGGRGPMEALRLE